MQNLTVKIAILVRIFLHFREGRKSYVDKMLKKTLSAINPNAKVTRKKELSARNLKMHRTHHYVIGAHHIEYHIAYKTYLVHKL